MLKKIKHISEKVNQHGIGGSFRVVSAKIKNAYMCISPWFIRAEFYFHLMRLIFTPLNKGKRILGIWDFKALPWSIGDPLVFIENLSIMKIKNNAEAVDICVVYDRDYPVGNRGRSVFNKDLTSITSENAQDYMLEFLPLFSTCPYLGSVFQFNSREEFHRFLKTNISRYDVFPSLDKHLAEAYNYLGCPAILSPMQEFYNRHGYIPYLRIGDRDKSWAQWLYMKYLPEGIVPVTLSLKQTSHCVECNADPHTWLAFIDRCKLDFPEVVFVVVGLREEIFPGLRERANVIIAKDFGTSVIEDLALIRSSLLYMATSSGVNIIAMFSDLPYLIFQMEVSNYLRHGLKPLDKFSFVLDTQKIFSTETKVTPEVLFSEFKQIYSKLDKAQWKSRTSKTACKKHSHPTTKVLD